MPPAAHPPPPPPDEPLSVLLSSSPMGAAEDVTKYDCPAELKALLARSVTPVEMLTVYAVPALKSEAGLKVTVLPDIVRLPEVTGSRVERFIKDILDAVRLDERTGSLKVMEIFVLREIFVELFSGVILTM